MQRNEQAFTLIELLVVVLIIGILAAVALPQYQLAVDKSYYTEIMSLVKHVKVAQEVHYLANGEYASDCESLGVDVPTNTSLDGDKNIRENNAKFRVICNHDSNTHDNVTGIIPRWGGATVFTMYFDHIDNTDNAGKSKCYASDKIVRGVKICNSFCGPVTSLDNGGKECYFN